VKCAKGNLLSWTPYLLNFIFYDYKDAKDPRIEFHYAWLIILIALVCWGEPKYNRFYPRPRKCRIVKYTTLWHTSDAKQRKENYNISAMYYDEMHENLANTWKENSNVFAMHYDDMQENLAHTWRIPQEVVEEHQSIDDFQDSRHNMWIQAKRDPNKEWIQLRYYVTREEV
jgi:hypothetical protein